MPLLFPRGQVSNKSKEGKCKERRKMIRKQEKNDDQKYWILCTSVPQKKH
jgi:hypothetical protein